MIRRLIPLAVFILVLSLHWALTCAGFYQSYGKFGDLTFWDYMRSYMEVMKHFSGLAMGLLGFFISYLALTYGKYRDIKAVRPGLMVAFIILTGLYLVFGIHGSTPMFSYWVAKLGYFYVKAQYAVFFLATVLAVIPGLIVTRVTTRRLQQEDK